MFEEGQRFPHAYHRSKYESEKLVRESRFDYRIYRPSSVVGDSTTGAIDKIDGIYFSFGAIQKLAYALPAWVRLPAPRIRGAFNVVPVDYVADAMVYIALHDVRSPGVSPRRPETALAHQDGEPLPRGSARTEARPNVGSRQDAWSEEDSRTRVDVAELPGA